MIRMELTYRIGPYEETKDTDLPWLGAIPSHWQTLRGKNLFLRMNRPIRETDEVVTCFRDGTVTLRRNRRTHGFTEALKEIGYQGVRKGDLVIHAMDAFAGAVGVSDSDGKSSPVYAVCAPQSDQILPDYYARVVREMSRSNWILALAKGIRERSTDFRFDTFASQELPVPPLEEQQAIARFLDRQDRRINRFIRAKRRLIDLLNEQKQAIIHQAVTRGLDPSVPLRPSGISTFGYIPQHWQVSKLHRITDPSRPIMYGIVLPGPNVDEGVYIVKGGNCEPGRLRPEHLSRTTFDIEASYVRSRLRGGDIVYAIRGSIGAAELVPSELTGANLTQDAARIAPGPSIYPRWLLYLVRSRAFFTKMDAGAVGATIRGINIRDLKRGDVVVPPYDEQIRIADHLDAALAQIESARSRAQTEIELMREYRTRLIADVVTGKLDVRHRPDAQLSSEEGDLAEFGEIDDELRNELNMEELDPAPEE